jgi:hypothetical protein
MSVGSKVKEEDFKEIEMHNRHIYNTTSKTATQSVKPGPKSAA